MGRFATIYVLCYGDYLSLHKRVLNSLTDHLPDGKAWVVIWGNNLSVASKTYIEAICATRGGSFSFFNWFDNVPKYEVMRRMWQDPDGPGPRTPWTLWLDDDTHIVKPDWWRKTMAFIKAHEDENICYIGQPWFVHHLPGQEEFIKQAKWYKGVPFEMHPTRNPKVKKPGIKFATGGYVWLRTDVIEQLKWPDERLVHNGGDTLLGEAIRQQGLPRHFYDYGVKVNDAKRRGRSDKPAGSTSHIKR